MNGHPGKVNRKFYKCIKSTASLENELEPYQTFYSYFLEVLMVENKYIVQGAKLKFLEHAIFGGNHRLAPVLRCNLVPFGFIE